MSDRNEIVLSRTIAVDVWFDRSNRIWGGRLKDRTTGFQLGDAWWGISRDEVLVSAGMFYFAEVRNLPCEGAANVEDSAVIGGLLNK